MTTMAEMERQLKSMRNQLAESDAGHRAVLKMQTARISELERDLTRHADAAADDLETLAHYICEVQKNVAVLVASKQEICPHFGWNGRDSQVPAVAPSWWQPSELWCGGVGGEMK